jgi:hypothetical protein
MRTLHLSKRLVALLASLLVTAMFAACGTGGGSGNASSSATGNVSVVLSFAPVGQAHPHGIPGVGGANLFNTTQSVQVELLDPNDKTHIVAGPKNADRNNQDQLTVTFDGVPVGSYLVYVLCYDGAGETGAVTAVTLPTVSVTSGTVQVPVSEANTPFVTGLSIAPANATVNIGATQQLTATATYNDDSTQDVTQLTTWSVAPSNQAPNNVSQPLTAATIDASTGLVTGVRGGTTAVQASFAGFTAQSTVTVPGLALLFNDFTHPLSDLHQAWSASKTYTLVTVRWNIQQQPQAVDIIPTDGVAITISGLGHGSTQVDATPLDPSDTSCGTYAYTAGSWVYTAPATDPVTSHTGDPSYNYVVIYTRHANGTSGPTLTIASEQ